MPLNNVPFEGDDARWKREVEHLLKHQAAEIAKLERQVTYLQRRVK